MLKVLDVAIGVAFLYLLLTLVASSVLELIASLFNWRGQMLHQAIQSMLEGSDFATPDKVMSNPLVKSLQPDAKPKANAPKRLPSYIPAATFSAAVLDTLLDGASELATKPESALHSIGKKLQKSAQASSALRTLLVTTLATQGQSIQALRFSIEKWFNDSMDRTSGKYKRRTQACLLGMGIVAALALNINTIDVVQWLWQGDAAREAVIAAAKNYVDQNPPKPAPKSLPPQQAPNAEQQAPNSEKPPTPNGENANSASVEERIKDLSQTLVNVDKRVTELQYPIGWPVQSLNAQWFIRFLIGTLITAVAISAGSSFWFDALQSMVKIRGTGPKPGAR